MIQVIHFQNHNDCGLKILQNKIAPNQMTHDIHSCQRAKRAGEADADPRLLVNFVFVICSNESLICGV